MEGSWGRILEVVSTPWRRWADGVAHSSRANCCSTRRFLLATPPGAGPCQMQPPPAEPLASGLDMHCALGAVTSSESQKKDTKRATSCEVALSKLLVVGHSPATDSSMNVRKTGGAYSCVPMRKIRPGRILPQNPLGSITFRRSRLDTNLYPCPTGAKASIYSQGLPDHPQDLLPSRNRAFMGSHPPQGVHHDHHPL